MQLRDETEVEGEVDDILNEMESTFDTESQAVEKVAPLLKHVAVAR